MEKKLKERIEQLGEDLRKIAEEKVRLNRMELLLAGAKTEVEKILDDLPTGKKKK